MNEAFVQWLRLQTHVEWFPYPNQTTTRYKVFDILHMLWMGIWIHHHAVTAALASQNLGSQLKSRVTPW
jgi:hypothetical protein